MTELLFNVKNYEEAYIAQSEYYELKNELDSSNSASNVTEIEEKYKLLKEQLEFSKLALEKSEDLTRSQHYNMIASYFFLLVLAIAFFFNFGFPKTATKTEE